MFFLKQCFKYWLRVSIWKCWKRRCCLVLLPNTGLGWNWHLFALLISKAVKEQIQSMNELIVIISSCKHAAHTRAFLNRKGVKINKQKHKYHVKCFLTLFSYTTMFPQQMEFVLNNQEKWFNLFPQHLFRPSFLQTSIYSLVTSHTCLNQEDTI